MPAIVFASAGGQKYHFDMRCKAFELGQQLNDVDTPDDAYLASWAYRKLHPLKRMSSTKAAMDGKLPCLACVPAHLRDLPETGTFGHEPVLSAWGIVFGEDNTVCKRCRKRSMPVEDDYGNTHPGQLEQVSWPCTSAIVLGLAPRPCPHCKGSRLDPDDEGDYLPEVQRHDPHSIGPCPECNGSGLKTPTHDVA